MGEQCNKMTTILVMVGNTMGVEDITWEMAGTTKEMAGTILKMTTLLVMEGIIITKMKIKLEMDFQR